MEVDGARPSRAGLGPAVAYYAAMGLFGLALAAWFVLSLVEAVTAGYCEGGGGLVCGHSLESLIAPSIAALVAATLLPTARRLRRQPPDVGPVSAVGAIVGVLIALLPNALIVMVGGPEGEINIFGSKTPVLALLAIFVWPFLWALASAITVWREAARRGKLTTHVVAAAGISILAGLGMFALATRANADGAVGDDLQYAHGEATLRLERPAAVVETGEVQCTTGPTGELQIQFSTMSEEAQPDGPSYDVTVTSGQRLVIYRDRPRDDGLEVLIEIYNADGMPDQLLSMPESRLAIERDGSGGTIRFAELQAAVYGDAGRHYVPSDVAGTFEWTCRAGV
jgi:hypothetical protein